MTNATVNNTLNRLTREDLVTRQRYRSIFLTDAGRQIAEAARERHSLVRDFLIHLGVDPETAEIDAEVSEEQLAFPPQGARGTTCPRGRDTRTI